MSFYLQFLRRYTVIVILVPGLLAFTSACSEDDDPITPSVNEATLLIQELEGQNGNYLNTASPAIVTAQEVYEDINGAKKFYIFDTRTVADYAKGHIQGTVNIPITDVLTHIAGINMANYEKIVAVCYTGQNAGWITALLRMGGYNNAFSMKYGMSSWHSDFDIITSKLNSDKEGQFVTTEHPKAAAGNLPNINTGKKTGSEILKDRVTAVHADGFSNATIDVATVFTNPAQYYIINYWPVAEYTSLGHIPGAIQYTPKVDLTLAGALKTLPTDKTIVLYCYTGQTSANAAAVLRVMGYDVKSLLYGTNAMIWQRMKNAGEIHFDAGNDCYDFPYVK